MKLNEGNVNCPTCTTMASCCCKQFDVKLRVRPLKEPLRCKEPIFLPKFLKVHCNEKCYPFCVFVYEKSCQVEKLFI